MTFDAALVREQGQTFAVVVVRQGIINNTAEANKAQASFAPAFDYVPIVLMEQSGHHARYYGRPDIVRFLANIDFRRLPWKQWAVS